ncbi:unnamed protein product [Clonostachys rhizophaga]|uniref:Uncharacterized protein n=1 Tax=Clonostachys rhizophaga TaxID=160324 RepID=A0A9N9YMQ0_9HYPO|nr:unnamed protein product [Clonostachys rhizophaga]
MIHRVPNDLPAITWIPVEVAAKAVSEVALLHDIQNLPQEVAPPRVYHVMNPKAVDWAAFVLAFKNCNSSRELKDVPFAEWTGHLQQVNPSSMSEQDAVIIKKSLPFFEELSETITRGLSMQPGYELGKTIVSSKALANAAAVDNVSLCLWMKQWNI